MMAAAYDNSNWNGGAAMCMGGADTITSHLSSRLLLVSVPFLFLGIRSWQTCVFLVCVPSH